MPARGHAALLSICASPFLSPSACLLRPQLCQHNCASVRVPLARTLQSSRHPKSASAFRSAPPRLPFPSSSRADSSIHSKLIRHGLHCTYAAAVSSHAGMIQSTGGKVLSRRWVLCSTLGGPADSIGARFFASSSLSAPPFLSIPIPIPIAAPPSAYAHVTILADTSSRQIAPHADHQRSRYDGE